MKKNREKEKQMKFNVIIILLGCIFLFCTYKGYINISSLHDINDTSVHFNLITVNSIFSGFLFSSLSLIVGLNGTKSISNFEKAGFMDSIYFNLVAGIGTSIMSIIFSLIMLFGNSIIAKVGFLYKFLIPSLELLFLLITILIFIKATIDVMFIIKSIRRNSKNKYCNKDISKTLEKIN